MTILKFGLRYERLLVLAAPISLACILVAFIAIASDFASEKKRADCYDFAADLMKKNINMLQTLWEKRSVVGKTSFANEYVSETSLLMIRNLPYGCDYKIGDQDTNSAISPAKLEEKLKADSAQIREGIVKRPVRYYGIEIPERAAISMFGTTMFISILTLTQVMQLILFPILILWLGSLFNTRYRESILIEAARSISELHPHVINLYLNAKIPAPRKKSWLNYYTNKVIPYAPTVFRVLLLLIFILPPIVFYCARVQIRSATEAKLV